MFSPAGLLVSPSAWLCISCGWLSERSGKGAKTSRSADANVEDIGGTNREPKPQVARPRPNLSRSRVGVRSEVVGVVFWQRATANPLDRQTAELVEAERAWFEQWGVPHERTAVSGLAASLKDGIHNHSFSNGKNQIMGMGGGASDWAPR